MSEHQETYDVLATALKAHIEAQRGSVIVTAFVMVACTVPVDGEPNEYRYYLQERDGQAIHESDGLLSRGQSILIKIDEE